MIKIKFFSSFCDSKICKKNFERVNKYQMFKFYGNRKTYIFTEGDDYTHAIILNIAMPKLNIPKENVLGLAFEPFYFLGINDEFIEYAKNNIGRYFIGDKRDLPEPFIEHFSYMWHSYPPKEITSKNKLMSIILSNKDAAPGHKYRHELVKLLIEFDFPVDIYGRGSNAYKYSRVKGSFKEDSEPYGDYLFTICIENFITNDYFSEKIMSPIMYNCMPIYWGCKNIGNYLENYIPLNNSMDDNLKTIYAVIKDPLKYYKKPCTEKNLHSVNLIANLPKLFPK